MSKAHKALMAAKRLAAAAPPAPLPPPVCPVTVLINGVEVFQRRGDVSPYEFTMLVEPLILRPGLAPGAYQFVVTISGARGGQRVVTMSNEKVAIGVDAPRPPCVRGMHSWEPARSSDPAYGRNDSTTEPCTQCGIRRVRHSHHEYGVEWTEYEKV